MGFEPTTLPDLVGCSNHLATGDSLVTSKGELWVFDLNCISQIQSQITTDGIIIIWTKFLTRITVVFDSWAENVIFSQ